jgi:hypothetical protein
VRRCCVSTYHSSDFCNIDWVDQYHPKDPSGSQPPMLATPPRSQKRAYHEALPSLDSAPSQKRTKEIPEPLSGDISTSPYPQAFRNVSQDVNTPLQAAPPNNNLAEPQISIKAEVGVHEKGLPQLSTLPGTLRSKICSGSLTTHQEPAEPVRRVSPIPLMLTKFTFRKTLSRLA